MRQFNRPPDIGGTGMQSDSQEREWQEEAERLKLLREEDQQDLIATYRIVAHDPKRPKKDRERAAALVRLLSAAQRRRRSV
jgi:hypothetical protein